MNTQSVIDSIKYPPTHTYNLSPLYPTGILEKRMQIIERVCPNLFEGESFLDVGANKGYFMMRATQKCERVWAVEPDFSCCHVLLEIMPPGKVSLHCGTFGNFHEIREIPEVRLFDRVFIGNGHHYPYKEAGNWSWVDKLADLSTGIVVLEGPTGMECKDMLRTFPTEELRAGFNWEAMQAAFEPHFELKDKVPTYGYTPDRYVIRMWRTQVSPVQ